MPENDLQRAQRIADEVLRDPTWRRRDDDEQFAEMRRRIESAEHEGAGTAATRPQIVAASEVESQRVYPNFHMLRAPFELGFLAGAQWARDHLNGSTT